MTITRVDGLEMFAKFQHGPRLDTDPMLDRCRHCGSEAGYREDPRDKLLRVECSNTSCGIATPYHYRTRGLALKAWNRTAPFTVYSLQAQWKHASALLCGVFLTRQEAVSHKAASELEPDLWDIEEWRVGGEKDERPAQETRTVTVPQIGLRYTVDY